MMSISVFFLIEFFLLNDAKIYKTKNNYGEYRMKNKKAKQFNKPCSFNIFHQILL